MPEKSERPTLMLKWSREGLSDKEIAEQLRELADQYADERPALALALGLDPDEPSVELELARLLLDAYEELRQETAALAVVLKSTEDTAILTLNSVGIITNICRHSAQLLGHHPSKLIGAPVDLVLRRDHDRVLQSADEMRRASEQDAPVTSVRYHRRGDDSSFEAEHRLVALVGRLDEPVGFVRQIRDLTAQRVLEVHIEELELSIALMVQRLDSGSGAADSASG